MMLDLLGALAFATLMLAQVLAVMFARHDRTNGAAEPDTGALPANGPAVAELH